MQCNVNPTIFPVLHPVRPFSQAVNLNIFLIFSMGDALLCCFGICSVKGLEILQLIFGRRFSHD